MKKNVICGVLLLVFAFLYLLNALDMIPNFNIGNVPFLYVCAICFMNGVYKKSIAKIIYSLTFLYYFGASFVGLPKIGLFTLLVFATLLHIGIVLILGKSFKIFVIKADKNKNFDINFEDDEQNDENISITTTFGECKRYISSEDFKSCNISSTFGDVAIYFDNVTIKGDSATVNISANFGNVMLYVPKNWKVDSATALVFSNSKVEQNNMKIFDKTLKIKGSINFGNLLIKRI